MLKIKETNVKQAGHTFDYLLDNGELLHESQWNGEVYTVGRGQNEKTYRPVYRFEAESINLDDLEENSDEWDAAVEIIGFND
jgi:hypothetical protein